MKKTAGIKDKDKDALRTLGNCRFEILTEGDRFLGLGRIWIGQTLVRSGRLPWRFDTQSFTGQDLSRLSLLEVQAGDEELRIRLRAEFCPLKVKQLRDHSFDPIHETGDWDSDAPVADATVDLVLTPAVQHLGGESFEGFTFRYEYCSDTVPLFYLYDMASWELDGDICGATVINQSTCSEPCVTFEADTVWTTEGVLPHIDPNSAANSVMTHNLPRWAGHQCFDFQCRDGNTLLGVFERVDLIRSLLRREPGKAELKTFDKYLFDQSGTFCTPGKSILLSEGKRSLTDQKNLWTWILDEVHRRARTEFGLREQPMVPKIRNEYWRNWDYDRIRTDALEAAVALGVEGLFSHDNLLKSAWSEGGPLKDTFTWNTCCNHEYEPISQFGGAAGLSELVRACKEAGVRLWGWTNSDQSLSSPLNRAEREDGRGWYVLLEDTRQKYGGAYAGCMSILDLNHPEAVGYFLNSHEKVRQETGLDAWWFDSFYNLAFMPVNYREGKPRTMWRALLNLVQQLQQKGHEIMIETFGPFGEPMCGCHPSMGRPENMFTAYKMTVNPGYTAVPTGGPEERYSEAESLYRFLAHMSCYQISLYQGGERIDRLWTPEHRRALSDYNRLRPQMHRRILQEDGDSVHWLNATGKILTVWNFRDRTAALNGAVRNISTGQDLPQSEQYALEACHTYQATVNSQRDG